MTDEMTDVTASWLAVLRAVRDDHRANMRRMYADNNNLALEVERLRGEVERLESSNLWVASMMAEQFCGEQVERLRKQVATLRAERDAMTSEEGPIL